MPQLLDVDYCCTEEQILVMPSVMGVPTDSGCARPVSRHPCTVALVSVCSLAA